MFLTLFNFIKNWFCGKSPPLLTVCHSILLVLLFSFPFSFAIAGNDKNGVSPNTISLPSGPGSIEGLGDSFQPMLNTGSARYAIDIPLPGGVVGNTPALRFQYDSGLGDEPAGIGWSFGPGFIGRQTDKGIPRYVDAPNSLDDDLDGEIDEFDELDTFMGPDGEELVRLADGTYRARIESHFSRYKKEDNYWEVDLKDGTRLTFGATPSARIMSPDGGRTFRWLLEKRTDINGNVIEYVYSALAGSDNQKFLKEIRYGPGDSPWNVFYFAAFAYESRPTSWRKDYRSGFLIKTAHRLIGIHIGIQGTTPSQCAPGDWNHDTVPDALIAKYQVDYNDQSPYQSLLSRITHYGSDGMNYLPPVSFTYSIFDPPPRTSALDQVIYSENAPPIVMDNNSVELIDLNRDGLADILKTDQFGGRHTGYLNNGVKLSDSNQTLEWSEGKTIQSEDGLAVQLGLSEQTVSLADMNGDGLSDLVHTASGTDVVFYPNSGRAGWGPRHDMSVQDTAPPSPFFFTQVKTADLDFNKRMDVVKSVDNGYVVWFNLEDGKYSREVHTPGAVYQSRLISFGDTGVKLADMNGDRMSDVAAVMADKVVYCPALGYGMFSDCIEMAIPDTTLTDSNDGQLNRADLTDINADGLTDLVVERAAAGELWFWLNRGTDTFSGKYVVTDMPVVYDTSAVIRWADMNGNGTTDLVYSDSSAVNRLIVIDIGVLTGGSAHPNLLKKIHNGLGVTTDIEYRSSTEFYLDDMQSGNLWNQTIPFPVQVVSRVITRTGLDLDRVPGLDEYVKTFQYKNGFYEDREKQFRGFADVNVIVQGDETSPTSISHHAFFTGGPDGLDNDKDGVIDEVSTDFHREEEALKGLVRSITLTTETGEIFNRQAYTWQVRNILVSPDNIEVRFAAKNRADTVIYEKTDTPETIRTTFDYDEFGNIIEAKNYGALSITGDEFFSYTEYINDTARWLIGFPKRQYTTNDAGAMAAETLYYYDGTDYTGLSLGLINKGLLSRQEGWVSDTDYVDLVRNAYDNHGNIISILDPNSSKRSVTYDPVLQTFPIQENIEVSSEFPDLTIRAQYNIGLGTVISSLDYNGNETTYSYDSFGRPTTVVSPGDSAQYPTQKYAYAMADPQNNLVYSYDRAGTLTLENGVSALASSVTTLSREISGQPGTLDVISYVDGMGRKLATVEEDDSGFIVSDAVLLNIKGSPRFSFIPYPSPDSAYSVPPANMPATETHYDAAGRNIENFTLPDDNGLIHSSTVAFFPLQQQVTDLNGNTKELFHDGLENFVRVEEQNGLETYTTRYGYNTIANLVSITDNQNNVKTMTYDGFGRKATMDDPDKGHMDYFYDNAGNLIRTVDNKGQSIVYTYDAAGRLLTEDFLDAADISPDVHYHYDVPSDDYLYAANLKGKVSWVEDLSGAHFFSYDARGNPSLIINRINDRNKMTDFRTAMEYDALGRVTAMVFPDNDRVEYRYNRRGLLQGIPGILSDISYTPSGRRHSINYPNHLATTYDYDSRLHLKNLSTIHSLQPEPPLQNLTYTVDPAGNITAIDDGRVLLPDTPANSSQTFQYDNLHRLIQAEGPGYGGINFQYDSIGNMNVKKSPEAPDPFHVNDPLINLGTMTYGGSSGAGNRGARLPGDEPGPHAVTGTASGLLYEYDDNGNVVSRAAGDTMEWDFKDRLIRASTADSVSEYVYDHTGQRVIKRVTANNETTTDYYLNNGYEVRNSKPVKYVYDDFGRVARIEGRLNLASETATQHFYFSPGWNFFSLTVEPATSTIADDLASISDSYTDVWTYDTGSDQYLGYVPGDGLNQIAELHAHTGYLIRVTDQVTLEIEGMLASGPIDLQPDWNLIASPTDTPKPLSEILLPLSGQYESVWAFDTGSNSWQSHLPDLPPFLNNLELIQPAKAYWIKMRSNMQLAFYRQPLKIYFYHNDHLGSTSLVTDSDGAVINETYYYPYGRPRHEVNNDFDPAYKYTGKELDKHTGLMYYEARYYDPVVGRFVSVDPLFSISSDDNEIIALQSYAYANLNPIIIVDSDGMRTDIFLERQVNPPRSGIASGGGEFDYANLSLAQGIVVGMTEGLVKMAAQTAKDCLRGPPGAVPTPIEAQKIVAKRRKSFKEKYDLYRHFLKDPRIMLDILNMPEGEVGRILGDKYITTYSVINNFKTLSSLPSMVGKTSMPRTTPKTPYYRRDLMKLVEQTKKNQIINKARSKSLGSRDGWKKIDGTWFDVTGSNASVRFED